MTVFLFFLGCLYCKWREFCSTQKSNLFSQTLSIPPYSSALSFSFTLSLSLSLSLARSLSLSHTHTLPPSALSIQSLSHIFDPNIRKKTTIFIFQFAIKSSSGVINVLNRRQTVACLKALGTVPVIKLIFMIITKIGRSISRKFSINFLDQQMSSLVFHFPFHLILLIIIQKMKKKQEKKN